MPTEEQIKELYKNCTKTATTLNGVNGQLVTGPNGNSIFLPYSGAFDGNLQVDIGEYGYLWSRTLYSNEPNMAFIIFCDRNYLYYDSVIERCAGFTVRVLQ